MKTLNRLFATLCLAACSLAVQAETLGISISGGFELPPLTAGPGTMSLSFELPEPLVGVVPQGEEAFVISNVNISAVFNGTPFTSTVNTVGWFNYVSSSYAGIDVRMANVLVPGDLMQFILPTFDILYSGTSSAPTLERLVLTGLGGAICYYGNGSGACTAEGTMSNATYAASVVPEPAAAWMLLLGLVFFATERLRRGRA